jgi:hypothetical protein
MVMGRKFDSGHFDFRGNAKTLPSENSNIGIGKPSGGGGTKSLAMADRSNYSVSLCVQKPIPKNFFNHSSPKDMSKKESGYFGEKFNVAHKRSVPGGRKDAKAYFQKYYNISVRSLMKRGGDGGWIYQCVLDDGTHVSLRFNSSKGNPTITFTESEKYGIKAQHIHVGKDKK